MSDSNVEETQCKTKTKSNNCHVRKMCLSVDAVQLNGVAYQRQSMEKVSVDSLKSLTLDLYFLFLSETFAEMATLVVEDGFTLRKGIDELFQKFQMPL